MGWRRGALIGLVLAGLSVSASAQQRRPTPEQLAAADAALAEFTSPRLSLFAGEEEFRRYLGAVLAARRARGWYWGAAANIQFAQVQQGDVQSDTVEPICPDSDPMCAEQGGEDGSVVVTGSRIPAPANRSVSPVTAVGATTANPNITNNQMRNVEEGDIVKQIGHHLLVLQDGRIFVIDIRGGDGRRLVLADRMNVYRDPRHHMWYDEMLVFGDRILITGYSYGEDATELSVFRLNDSGQLSREGVFYVSSNDYYDTSNYATRLIGDNLVIYTPFSVSSMAGSSFKWPVVRRWMADEVRDEALRRGRPLFDAGGIFRPVRELDNPTVHSVSVCPLGPVGAERDLECRTTAFVGPSGAEWYVTETDAFLWTTPTQGWYGYYAGGGDACAPGRTFASSDYMPALLYRVPVDGSAPGLVAARGVPPDQFSLHASGGHFHALLDRRVTACNEASDSPARLAYFDIPLSGFGDRVEEMADTQYTALPGVKSRFIANRFTDSYLVYGSLGRFRRGMAERSMPPAYAVPVGNPQGVRPLDVRHTVVRAEQAGNDIVLTGYRDMDGLFVTLIDLDQRPRIASSIPLWQRFESEGRSHAFNSRIEPDGNGVMGLPTISGETGSSRAAWRSSASDLSYLTVDRRGRLTHVGELERRFDYSDEGDEDGIPGYQCEVSCVDWYGNSRPIFTDGRIFALAGTELIEGRIAWDQILEVQRLNIALTPPPRLAAR